MAGESRRAANKRVDLVFEGGGVKGIALVGAWSVLEEHGFVPENIAGTSAGAIMATALAAGYSAAEQRAIMQELNFADFTDTTWEDRLPVVGKAISILRHQGVYEGDAFLAWMSQLLSAKGVETFRDLIRDPDELDLRYRYRVQVIASDLSTRELLVLPRDAAKLGTHPDDLNVALAVRMSMSIPLFFEPVRFRNPTTGRDHVIVDGGILSKFPVWLFDADGEPAWPTFGLRLVEDPRPTLADLSPDRRRTSRVPAWTTLEFLKNLVGTMMEAHDRLYIETADFARTIPIPTLGVRSTDFRLRPEQATALYESGERAGHKFLATWDFDTYVAEFRRGKPHSRRGALLREMGIDPAAHRAD